MNTYQPIPVEDIIKRVSESELGFLLSQAQEYCDGPEELEDWKKDVYESVQKRLRDCETIDDLRIALEEDLQIENPSEYILDNYIIR